MKFSTLGVAALVAMLGGTCAFAEATLEERVKSLEMKAVDKPAEEKKGSAVSVYFDDGLRFKTDDGSFVARIGGLAIFHYTTHGKYNEGDGKIDGFSTKHTGLQVYARLWSAFEIYVYPQFSGGGASLFAGWVEFNKWDALKLRVGQFKEPYSAEFSEEVRWWDMPEQSLVSITGPKFDLGAMLYGTPFSSGILNYWIGAFNGNGTAGTDNNSDKDLAARVTLRPGAGMETDAIKWLTFGVSATDGRSGRNSGTPFGFTTPATGTTFHSAPPPLTFESNFRRRRFGADVSWIFGPLSVKAEVSYVRSKHEFASGSRANFRAKSYMAQAGFWLFGSTRLNGKRPAIKKALFGAEGGFGDLQIVGRYSRLGLDDTFEEYAGFKGSRNVDEWALCLNYYPNAFVRLSGMFVQYNYDEGSSRSFNTASGRRMNHENAVIIRAQIDF